MNILIFGATSAIAQAVARRYADAEGRFVLVARDSVKLAANAADLIARGATVPAALVADLEDGDRHGEWVAAAVAALGTLDVVLIAHGTLPDQAQCEADAAVMRRAIAVNFVSAASLATHVAQEFERQRSGRLAVIASVAGDRGKRSNYVYGAAKAGLAVYLQGLRARLAPCGASVLTIKPGFVDTPMTAGFAKGALWATPERVAAAICRAVAARRSVIYVPWFWRPIMLVIRLIPERLFIRMRM
jgi:short-subunit dehydrogenase